MAISRNSIKDQVYQEIKDSILNKEYRPGDILSIAELSRRYEISNSPLREALAMLTNEGLLCFQSNGKYSVIAMSEEKVQQLNGAMVSLLIGSAIFCQTHNLDKALIRALETALEKQKASIGSSPLLKYKTAIEFDRQIVLETGNELLIDSFERMETMLFLCTSLVDGKSDNSIAEHERILDAIRSRSIKDIIEALEKHYDKHLLPECHNIQEN